MISFDGFSGTGKTTQARIISETYRIPLIYWDNQFESWHPEVNSLEAAIRTYCNLTCFLKTDKEVFILDCCMFGVIRYLVFNASDEQRINFINIFDNIIQSTLSREPLCFYLFMPEQLATYQRDKREGNATILETPIKSNETDQKFKEIVDQISERLPYFHVIDGTGSVEEVSKRVFNILYKSAYGDYLEKN